MAGEIPRHLFTVNDFHRMAEAGILSEDERVELIEGAILVMSPIGSLHAACIDRLNRFLSRQLGEAAIVRVQSPIRLSDYTEPQPDLSLLKPRDDFYAERHPTPEDVLLVIEVADTSLAYDQGVNVPLYARAGIPEVWLFDLTGEIAVAYAEPVDGQYRQTRQVRRGDVITSSSIRNLAVEIDAILG